MPDTPLTDEELAEMKETALELWVGPTPIETLRLIDDLCAHRAESTEAWAEVARLEAEVERLRTKMEHLEIPDVPRVGDS